MQNLRNKITRIILGWIVVVLVWFSIFVVVNLIPSKMVMGTVNEGVLRFQRLAEVSNYESKFIAISDNLNRVDVLFKNPNLESRDEVLISILDENKSTVYKQNFTGFNFGDTSYARLDFLPIAKSIDHIYSVQIVPTKIVDGKLSFGVRGLDIETTQYFGSKFSIKNSIINSVKLMQNWVLVVPLLLVTLFLW